MILFLFKVRRNISTFITNYNRLGKIISLVSQSIQQILISRPGIRLWDSSILPKRTQVRKQWMCLALIHIREPLMYFVISTASKCGIYRLVWCVCGHSLVQTEFSLDQTVHKIRLKYEKQGLFSLWGNKIPNYSFNSNKSNNFYLFPCKDLLVDFTCFFLSNSSSVHFYFACLNSVLQYGDFNWFGFIMT